MRQPVRTVAHRNRNGTLSIRLRVTLDGKAIDIASGVTVDASDWDKRRQRVTASHPDHRALNATIDNLGDQLRDYTAKHPTATPSQLRAAVQHPAPTIIKEGYITLI